MIKRKDGYENMELKKLIRNNIKFILLIGIFLLAMVMDTKYCMAKEYKLKLNETKRVVISKNDEDDEVTTIIVPKSSCNFTVIVTNIRVTIAGQNRDDMVKYVVVNDALDTEKVYHLQNDKIIFNKNGDKFEEDRQFFIDFDIDAPYIWDSYSISCDITVTSKSVAKLSKTSLVCYLNNIDGVSTKLNNASGSVKWKISNNKIASIASDGNFVTVTPKKIGTCNLTATCAGKTYKCKVRIKGRKSLYAGGTLDSYNTRSNVFVMRFKNCSKKNIKIKARGAVAVDSDYTKFDRNLKLKKNIIIKPGQVKKLKFKVVGNSTWYNVSDFCVNYTVIYKGKEYRMATGDTTTWIRKNKKWKKLLDYENIAYL